MDLRFMWYATTTVINTILPKYQRFDDEYEIVLNEEDIRDKYMRYVVSVGGRTFHYVYTFFSNVCVSGSLEITDTQNGDTYTYAVERNNDSVRLYSDLENYSEIYSYNRNMMIDIQINNCRKSCIAVVNIGTIKDNLYRATVIKTTVDGDYVGQFDQNTDNILFTVSGAIDYPNMTIWDVVDFANHNSQMTIYTETKCQLITIHSFGVEHSAGTLTPINADFNQHLDYKRVGPQTYSVTEYITNTAGQKLIKRAYEFTNKPGRIIEIPKQKLRFKISNRGNDFTIIRMK